MRVLRDYKSYFRPKAGIEQEKFVLSPKGGWQDTQVRSKHADYKQDKSGAALTKEAVASIIESDKGQT